MKIKYHSLFKTIYKQHWEVFEFLFMVVERRLRPPFFVGNLRFSLIHAEIRYDAAAPRMAAAGGADKPAACPRPRRRPWEPTQAKGKPGLANRLQRTAGNGAQNYPHLPTFVSCVALRPTIGGNRPWNPVIFTKAPKAIWCLPNNIT